MKATREPRNAGRRASTLRWHRFPRTPLLLTLPPDFGRPEPVKAQLRGVWSVEPVHGGRLVIRHFRAALLLPAGLRLRVGKRALRLGRLRVDLRESDLGRVGPEGAFGIMNQGVLDARTRSLSATVGLRGRLPKSLGGGRFDLAMRTFGILGAGGTQIGGGAGLVLTGLFMGTIICCAGPRLPLRPDEPVKPPPPPSVPVETEPEVGTAGDPAKVPDGPKKKSPDPITEAKAGVGAAVALARRAGLFESIGIQLKAAGLPGIRIRFQINVQDGLLIIGLAGHTQCGDPIVITINISQALDFDVLLQVLAHELVHAKECAYKAAGVPPPYNDDHDSDAFKAKIKEFLDKLKEQQKKDSEEAQKAFEKEMGGH